MLRFALFAAAVACAVAVPVSTTNGPANAMEVKVGGNSLRYWPVAGELCDPTVTQHAGYFNVTTATKEYFFWEFASRSNPATDPLILWMTGGPGCSSTLALLSENGPCTVSDDGQTTKPNPFSWNSKANVIYIDQPSGTGFSYGKITDMDHNEAGVSRDMYNFLQAFFTARPELQKNDFFIFGESYAGHYVPATANAVFDGNANKTGLHINLAGFAIGNGLTAPEIQYLYYPEMAFNNSLRPLIPHAEYVAMKAAAEVCVKSIKLCQDHETGCIASFIACNTALVTPIQLTGINLYDIRQKCTHPPLCYDFSGVSKFLNRDDVRTALGVSLDRKWSSCNMAVNALFRGDWMHHFQVSMPKMLAGGVRGLIYAGDMDFICNYMGNKAWTLEMEWAHKAEFNAAADKEWMVDGQVAGLVRSSNDFTFLQIHKAGHMSPMDAPQATLQMVNAFITNQPLA